MRPSASIIVPFIGDDADLARVLERMARIRRQPQDELIVVDNRPSGTPGPAPEPGDARLIQAGAVQSPGFARNAGARAAHGQWLVLLDADVIPDQDLLTHYFEPDPRADVGVLAGGIRDVASGNSLCARYVVARAKMAEHSALAATYRPYAQSANCAVRAEAFAAVGGFAVTRANGEDADLCWRLAAAGWRLEHRPRPSVEHLARESLPDLLAQLARHGAGMAWLERRYPGSFPPPNVRELAGRLPRHLIAATRARGDERSFALLDALALCARDAGRLRTNAPR